MDGTNVLKKQGHIHKAHSAHTRTHTHTFTHTRIHTILVISHTHKVPFQDTLLPRGQKKLMRAQSFITLETESD